MNPNPETAANSDIVSQGSTSPEGITINGDVSREAETLLISSSLNMDFKKLRLIAIEHLLIHAEETALLSSSISKSELDKWYVHERRQMMDHILSRKFDEALISLAEISPRAVDIMNSSGVIVTLLCAKAREIAMKDEDAALKFISEDVADAAVNLWGKDGIGYYDNKSKDETLEQNNNDNNGKKTDKGIDIIGSETLIDRGESNENIDKYTIGNHLSFQRDKNNQTYTDKLNGIEENIQPMCGNAMVDGCYTNKFGNYFKDYEAIGELVEKTIGDVLFMKTSNTPPTGPSLGNNELENLAMAVNTAALKSLGLPSVSVLTSVLDIWGNICTPRTVLDWSLPTNNNYLTGSERMTDIRSQNHPLLQDQLDDRETERDEEFQSWGLKTLLGVRLVE